MKTTQLLITFALLNISIIAKVNAKTALNVSTVCMSNTFITDDPNVVINLVKDGSQNNLQVSFNGNEGSTGSLKVYNASNQLVTTFSVTLVSSPGSSTVNLAEFASGTYSVELTTSSGVHTSHFTIN